MGLSAPNPNLKPDDLGVSPLQAPYLAQVVPDAERCDADDNQANDGDNECRCD